MKIDRGIPLPPSRRGRGSSWPFAELQVTDSFLVTGQPQTQVAARMKYWSERLSRRFATRKVDGGIRVWRIE
jgi:hypothetical protein